MLRQHIVGFFQLVNVDVDFVRFQNKVRPERAQVDAIRVLVDKPIGNDGTALHFIKNGLESGVERSLFGVGRQRGVSQELQTIDCTSYFDAIVTGNLRRELGTV